jgi:DNA-binding CsgD family transcriptional regulator
MRAELYLEAVEAFAEAGVDGAAWPAALAILASAARSSRGELVGIGPKGLSFCVAILPQEAYREFEAAGGYNPQVNPRIAAAQRAAPMQVVGDREYDELAPLLRTDAAYMDVVSKYDIPSHGCQTTLVLEPHLLVGLTVLRTRRESRIDADATAAFTALAPHALGAVRTRLALGDRNAREMATALEHAGVAAFLCDGDGKVRAMTGRAEQLALDERLVTVRQDRLGAARPADRLALRRAMAAALAAAVPACGVETLLIGPEGGRAVVHIRALAQDDWGLPFRVRLMVIVRQGPRKPSVEVLRLAFGLTTAEAEIALALAAGQPRDLIAAHRGVTVGTLRQQVKAVFAKAGVSREAELIVAVHGLE